MWARVVCDVFVGEGVDLLAEEGVAELLSESEVPCLDCYSFEYYMRTRSSHISSDIYGVL